MLSRQKAQWAWAGLIALCALAPAAPASAMPNMIRIGYPDCQSCHLTPQGGGLLTTYGKGVDLTQSMRPKELKGPAEFGEDVFGSRLNYDARLAFGIDRDPPANAAYGFKVLLRAAVGLVSNHRLVYGTDITTQALGRTRTAGAVNVALSRLYWLYQPKEGLSFAFGRDELPSGLGWPDSQAFAARVASPGISATPTQAKVFWWNARWEVTAYGFGPDGNETDHRFRARGGGAVVGADVWRNRAVVGVTTRVSRADVFDRTSAGVFARIGFSEHWGVLAEHDVTSRTVSNGPGLTHLTGHTELFFVPFEWLKTSVALDHRTTSSGVDTYRLSPSAAVRFTENLKVGFSIRDVHTDIDSRTYLFELLVKAQ
jgi:hypothetical protein